MRPMRIKAYIRWKRDEAFKQRDLLDALKRVVRAKAIFEAAMEDHVYKNGCKIIRDEKQPCPRIILHSTAAGEIKIEQVMRCAEIFNKPVESLPMPWQPAPNTVQVRIPDGIDPWVSLKKKSVKANFGIIQEIINHKHDV